MQVVFLGVAPWIFASNEQWSICASVYFTLQAFLAIGYGMESPKHSDWFLIVLIVVSIVLFTFIVAWHTARQMSQHFPKMNSRWRQHKDPAVALGASKIDKKRFLVFLGFLIVVLLASLPFGFAVEGWDAIKTLYFALAASLTAGLQAADPTDECTVYIFLSIFSIVAVGVGMIVTAQASQVISDEYLRQERLADASYREHSAELAFRDMQDRIKQARGLASEEEKPDADQPDAHKPCVARVDRAGFLTLWLLRNGVVDSTTMKAMESEFHRLQRNQMVPLWKVHARLRYLQACAANEGSEDILGWEEMTEQLHAGAAEAVKLAYEVDARDHATGSEPLLDRQL